MYLSMYLLEICTASLAEGEFIMFKGTMSSEQSGSTGRHKATPLKEEAFALSPSLDKLSAKAGCSIFAQ